MCPVSFYPLYFNNIRPFETLEDMEQSQNRFPALMDISLENVQSNISLIKKYLQSGRMQYYDPKNGSFLKDALGDGGVVIMPELVLESMVQSGLFQNLYLLDGRLCFMPYSLALRKGWAWTDRVNNIMAEFGEDGIFDAIMRQYRQKYRHSSRSQPLQNSPSISVDKLYGLGIILTIYAAIAVLISLVTAAMPKTAVGGGQKIRDGE